MITWLDGMNKIIHYVEAHLEEEINYEAMADILGYSVYHFQRLFLLIAGTSIAEYIRCRRLSKAAADILAGEEKILDIAVKYQYASAGSFNRAFKAMHGVAPSEVRKEGTMIKSYPPLSFELTIKGAEPMEYRIMQMDSFRVVGKKLHTTMENGECYGKVPQFWADMQKNGGPGEILALMEKPPFGILGVSDYNPDLHESDFNYFIAVSSEKEVPQGMEEMTVPACTWAVFPYKMDTPDKLQKFQHRIVMEWLPSSGYEFAKAPDVEVYDDKGNVEIWLPVIKRGKEK